jgi:hypothetical protein
MASHTSARLTSGLSRLGDWLLIATCVLVLGILAFRYLAPSAGTVAREFSAAEAVPTGVSIGNHKGHVLVYAHSACRYCSDSMPFYKTLSRATRSADFAVTFLTVEDVGKFLHYLGTHGIDDPHVQRVDRFSGIPGTPSLVIVGRDKRVVGLAGRLSARQEDQVKRLIGLD